MLDKVQTLEQAVDLQRQGEIAAAEEIYHHLIAENPHRDDVLFGYAVLCMDRGRFEEAIDPLSRAAALVPDSVDYHFNLGIVLFRSGRVIQADAFFAKALRLNPDCREASAMWDSYRRRPNMYTGGAYQGSHAPERQVFLSATADLMRHVPSPLRILEIGSHMGASMLTWANAVGQLYDGECEILCVDPWGELSDENSHDICRKEAGSGRDYLPARTAYEAFCHNALLVPETVTVTHARGTSSAVLPHLRDGHFDIVYIDGCHYFDEVLADITEGSRVLKRGGILCGDDLELQRKDCDLEHAQGRRQMDLITDPASGRQFHPGVTLAVDEYFGEVSAYRGFWAMRKGENDFERVSYRGARGVLPSHWPDNILDDIKRYFAASNELGALIA